MTAKDLISELIPCLKPTDHGLKALGWMEEFKVSHLPIVNKGEYVGMVSDSDIIDLNEPKLALGKSGLNLPRPFVYESQHIYEIVKVISANNLTVIAVLNQDNSYSGLISLSKLVQHFTRMAALSDPGGIIVLEMNQNDYMLSQIAQIVESNDTRILSCYVSSPSDSNKLEVAIKLNRSEVSAVLQTFERYNYKILSFVQERAEYEDVKDRYDEFMRFLNV